MKFDQYEYTISEHLLAAIIDGDYSDLSDAQMDELDTWLNTRQERGANWDTNGYVHFARCEVTNLMNDCVQLLQHVPARSI
jgi:hypothetical protein